MPQYTLFKGFAKLGTFDCPFSAKHAAPQIDGIYNIICRETGYAESWQIINGNLYQ